MLPHRLELRSFIGSPISWKGSVRCTSTRGSQVNLSPRLLDLTQDIQSLAELESLDNGKPVSIARDSDIKDSISCLRYFAGWADKIAGQTIPVDTPDRFVYTRHEPVGVCGAM